MRILISFCFLILFSLVLFNCSPKQNYSDKINPILEKYLEAWNEGNLDVLDTITSENFELRINPDFEAETGRDKLKESITRTRTAYPDFLVKETDKLFISDTAVVLRWTITGTNTGEGNFPPTGKETSSNGFSVLFFSDSTFTGEWIAYSELTWIKQLGFTITPPSLKEEK